MLQYYFSLRLYRLIKWSFFIHSTLQNTPYVHPRLIPISNCAGISRLNANLAELQELTKETLDLS